MPVIDQDVCSLRYATHPHLSGSLLFGRFLRSRKPYMNLTVGFGSIRLYRAKPTFDFARYYLFQEFAPSCRILLVARNSTKYNGH